jgi:hypothetical protein
MLLEVPLEELPDEYAVNLLDLRPFQCIVVASPVLVRDVQERICMPLQDEVYQESTHPAVSVGKQVHCHEPQVHRRGYLDRME